SRLSVLFFRCPVTRTVPPAVVPLPLHDALPIYLRCRVLPRFQIPAVEVEDRDRGGTESDGNATGRVEVADHLGDGGLVADDIGTGRIRGDRVDRIHPVSDLTGIERGVLTQ